MRSAPRGAAPPFSSEPQVEFSVLLFLRLNVLLSDTRRVTLTFLNRQTRHLTIASTFRRGAIPLRHHASNDRIMNMFMRLLIRIFPNLPMIGIRNSLRPTILNTMVITPSATYILFLGNRNILPRRLLILMQNIRVGRRSTTLFRGRPNINGNYIRI